MSFDDVYSYAFEAGKKAGKSERTAELWSYGLLFVAAAFFFWSSSDGLDQYKSFNKATEITAGHIVDQGPGDEDHDDWALYRFNVDGITYEGWSTTTKRGQSLLSTVRETSRCLCI